MISMDPPCVIGCSLAATFFREILGSDECRDGNVVLFLCTQTKELVSNTEGWWCVVSLCDDSKTF